MSKQKLDIPDVEGMGSETHDGPVAHIFKGDFSKALKAVHPWYDSSEDEKAKADDLINTIKEELLPLIDVKIINASKVVPIDLIEKMSEIGLFKIKAAEEYGGLGLKQLEYNRVLVFLGSIHPSLPAYVSATNSLGLLYPLVHYGTDAQKEMFLGDVLEWPTGFCFTESEAGSNPAAIATFATRAYEAGNLVGYNITGEKWYTTNALHAKFLAVVAFVTDDPEGKLSEGEKKQFGIFLVDTNSEGVTIGPANDFAGIEGIDNANPTFKNVFVPQINLIGKEGEGFRIALEGLNSGRTAVAATGAGTHKWAHAVNRWWTKNRSQMGGPIGEQQLITQKVYEGAVKLYAGDAITRCAAGRCDRGLDGSLESALCKRVAVGSGYDAIDDALQIRGGRGYETRSSLLRRELVAPEVEQVWRAARVSRIFEGTEQIVSLYTFAEGFIPYLKLFGPLFPGKPILGKPFAALKVAGIYASLYMPQSIGGALKDFPKPLRKHLVKAEKLNRKLARKIIMICGKNGARMPRMQNHMERFFLITAELYAIIAVCSLAVYEKDAAGIVLADEYCRFSFMEMDRIFREFSKNCDDRLFPFYKALQEGEFDSLEEGIMHPVRDE